MATMTLWLRRTLVRPEQYGAHRKIFLLDKKIIQYDM